MRIFIVAAAALFYFSTYVMAADKEMDNWFSHANDLLSSGSYSEAIEIYESILESSPFSEKVYHKLAEAYNAAGMTEKEIEAYKKIIWITPDDSKTIRRLADAYFKLGMNEQATDAMASFNRAVSKGAKYRELGDKYMRLRLYNKAADEYSNAVRINPDDVLSLYGLGVAYLSAGNKVKASETYLKLKEQEPGMAGKLYDLIFKK